MRKDLSPARETQHLQISWSFIIVPENERHMNAHAHISDLLRTSAHAAHLAGVQISFIEVLNWSEAAIGISILIPDD